MKHKYKENTDLNDLTRFGTFLMKKRQSLGMCQGDLGEFLGGYTQRTISAWEKGNTSPPFEEARQIIEFLEGEIQILEYSTPKDEQNQEESATEKKNRLIKKVAAYYESGWSRVAF